MIFENCIIIENNVNIIIFIDDKNTCIDNNSYIWRDYYTIDILVGIIIIFKKT